jgi:hypothetical protein
MCAKRKKSCKSSAQNFNLFNSVTNFNWSYRKPSCSAAFLVLDREQIAGSDFISRVSDVPTDVTRSVRDVNQVAIHSTPTATVLTVIQFDVCTGTERQFSDTQLRPLLHAPPGLTPRNCTFCPHSVYICVVVWIWEQTAIIFLYSINWLVFRHVRKISKGDYYLRRVCVSVSPFVCPSTWNNFVPTGRIFTKFYVWAFSKNLPRKFKVN